MLIFVFCLVFYFFLRTPSSYFPICYSQEHIHTFLACWWCLSTSKGPGVGLLLQHYIYIHTHTNTIIIYILEGGKVLEDLREWVGQCSLANCVRSLVLLEVRLIFSHRGWKTGDGDGFKVMVLRSLRKHSWVVKLATRYDTFYILKKERRNLQWKVF